MARREGQNIMNPSESPRTWRAPNWHSDLGDAVVQLEHLREFSLRLLSIMPSANVSLEIPEPGVMDVQVQLVDGTKAEVHSVPSLEIPEKQRFAVFFSPGTADENEVYALSIECAVRHFLRGGKTRPRGTDSDNLTG
jgi:hypothetical protein